MPTDAAGSCFADLDCCPQLGGICSMGRCLGCSGCSDSVSNGSETDVDCGGGTCSRCPTGNRCHTGTDCLSGVCTTSTCRAPTCSDGILNGNEVGIDCGGPCSPCGACAPGLVTCPGGCADLLSDPSNCGTCGNVCPVIGGGGGCFQGICSATGACPGCGPTGCDCDGDPANGCETNLASDPSNCGACGRSCVLPHATPSCLHGGCAVQACNSGYGDCDGVSANGCESDLTTDRFHCGACLPLVDCGAYPCSNCVAGVCEIPDCGGNGPIPCEPDCICTDTSRDIDNCGGCAVVCAFPHATATCVNYGCVLGGCDSGYADCDGDRANGCETNTASEAESCGGCGIACVLAHAAASCLDGVCAVEACDPGYGDCDGLAVDGCETDLRTDSYHCGTCAQSCNRPAGCPYSWCLGGSCYLPEGDPGMADCDCNPANGSETNVSASVSNCGFCGNGCSANHGTASCAAGICAIACAAGYGDCDGLQSTGCEATLTSDPLNCGICGNVCTMLGCGVPGNCVNGVCAASACSPGTCECDGNFANGCETNTTSDPAHCGGCTNICPAGFVCASSSCACDADIDCDAGTSRTVACAAGKCVCAGTACNAGERCLPGGTCG